MSASFPSHWDHPVHACFLKGPVVGDGVAQVEKKSLYGRASGEERSMRQLASEKQNLKLPLKLNGPH